MQHFHIGEFIIYKHFVSFLYQFGNFSHMKNQQKSITLYVSKKLLMEYIRFLEIIEFAEIWLFRHGLEILQKIEVFRADVVDAFVFADAFGSLADKVIVASHLALLAQAAALPDAGVDVVSQDPVDKVGIVGHGLRGQAGRNGNKGHDVTDKGQGVATQLQSGIDSGVVVGPVGVPKVGVETADAEFAHERVLVTHNGHDLLILEPDEKLVQFDDAPEFFSEYHLGAGSNVSHAGAKLHGDVEGEVGDVTLHDRIGVGKAQPLKSNKV